MKHVRWLVIVIFFGLVPALLMDLGSQLWLDRRGEGRLREATAAMERNLLSLRDDIMDERPRLRLCRDIAALLTRLDPSDLDRSRSVMESLENRYGDRARVIIQFIDTAPPRPVRGFWPPDLKKRVIWEYFGNSLTDHYRMGQVEVSASRRKLVETQIFSRRTSISTYEKTRGINERILFENRPMTLYWDFIASNSGKARGTAIAIAYILIDDVVYQQQYSAEKLLAAAQQQNGSTEIHLLQPALPAEKMKLISEFPQLRPWLEHPPENPVQVTDSDQIRLLISMGTGDQRLLLAQRFRNSVDPDRQKSQLRFHILILSVFILFLVIFTPIHYGWIEWRLSVRTQLVAVFLLAALLPMSTLFGLTFHFLRASEEMEIQRVTKKLEEASRQADNAVTRRLEDFRRMCAELLERPETRSLNLEWLEAQLSPMTTDKSIENYYVFGITGETLLRCATIPAGSFYEKQVLSPMARAMIHYQNNPGGEQDDLIAEIAGSMASIMLSNELGIRDNIMQESGTIRRINAFGYKNYLYFEAIREPSGKKAVAVLTVGFNSQQLTQNVIERLVKENNTQSERTVFLAAGRTDSETTRYPSTALFDRNDELERLIRRIQENPNVLNETIQMAWAENENPQKMLIRAGPVKALENCVLISMVPYREVEESIERQLQIFRGILGLSFLISIVLGLLISRKFIQPVRSLQTGVRAIAEGDLTYRMHIPSRDELGELADAFNRMVGGLQEKERMSRYVSEFVLTEVKKDRTGEATDEGRQRKATVLFADIRNFTGMTEQYPPSAVFSMLNDYLKTMATAIRESGGVIDKFIGDAIMAVFHEETQGGRGDESRAVIAALRMREELKKFNTARRAEGKFEIENGIGINTGTLLMGNVGSPDVRIDLTVIGDVVNVAARMEKLSKDGKHSKIIIASSTYEAVKDLVHVESSGSQAVRGKAEPLPVYEVVGLRELQDYLPWLIAPEPETRIQGLSLLSVINNHEAVPAIQALLQDENSTVRQKACIALRSFTTNHQQSAESMLTTLAGESVQEVRATLVMEIGLQGDDSQRLRLEPWLTDSDNRVRANAIEAIGRVQDQGRLINILRGYMRDVNNRIRGNACVMLWGLGEWSALDSLAEMATDKAALMRASAGWALGEIAGPEQAEALQKRLGEEVLLSEEHFHRLDRILELLHKLLEDPDPMVTRNAIRSLGKAGNRQSVHRLIRRYQELKDDELRGLVLSTLDAIGSYSVVRQLRET